MAADRRRHAAAMPPSMAGRAGSHRSPSAGSSANRSPGSAAARCSSQGTHESTSRCWSRRKAMRAAFRSPGQASRQRHFASAEVTGRQLRERYPVHHLRVRWDAAWRGPASGGCAADDDSRRAGQSREPRRTRAASRPPATAQGYRQGAGIVALKSALRPARAVLKVAGPRTSPWMIYWRRGSSRDGVLSRPRRGRFRPVPGHGLVSAKPKAPPASAFTAATEYSRPR